MKPRINIYLIFLLMIIFSSCDHKPESCSACGVENPTENLPWLKSAIENIAESDYQTLSKVDIIEYNSKQMILLSWTLNGIYDVPTGSIYNCNGDLLYHCGGNQPFDSCSYVVNNSKYIGNIWLKENNAP